jgi:multidrug efflux system membrane fusion protein
MIAIVAGGYAVSRHFARSPHIAPGSPAPVPVIATTVEKQSFPIVLTGIGNVTALNSATVRSMITEPILSIDFKDGQFVKKGELLAQLDPSTYQAQLDEAEANLARDQAHLENGTINLGRYVPLAKQGFAAEQQVATQQAKIAQEQATIQADQTAIGPRRSGCRSIRRRWPHRASTWRRCARRWPRPPSTSPKERYTALIRLSHCRPTIN